MALGCVVELQEGGDMDDFLMRGLVCPGFGVCVHDLAAIFLPDEEALSVIRTSFSCISAPPYPVVFGQRPCR